LRLEELNKPAPSKPMPARKNYKPDKDDPVDTMLATYLNELNVYVPVERIQPGQYMFGRFKVLI
jgi:hypothetical protein